MDLNLNTRNSSQTVGDWTTVRNLTLLIVLGNGFSVNGGTVGNSANPAWLTLNIYAGNLSINQGAKVYGYVTAPAGIVTINGGCELVGGLASDGLSINSNGLLRLTSPP